MDAADARETIEYLRTSLHTVGSSRERSSSHDTTSPTTSELRESLLMAGEELAQLREARCASSADIDDRNSATDILGDICNQTFR